MDAAKEKDPLDQDIERLHLIRRCFFSDDLTVEQVNQVTRAMDGLRASLESWARLVVELMHEKYLAEAEVERLRAELEEMAELAETSLALWSEARGELDTLDDEARDLILRLFGPSLEEITVTAARAVTEMTGDAEEPKK